MDAGFPYTLRVWRSIRYIGFGVKRWSNPVGADLVLPCIRFRLRAYKWSAVWGPSHVSRPPFAQGRSFTQYRASVAAYRAAEREARRRELDRRRHNVDLAWSDTVTL